MQSSSSRLSVAQESSCPDCLKRYLSGQRPTSTASPPGNACRNGRRCPLREIQLFGRISDLSYHATWLALASLTAFLTIAILTSV
ncbi:hypothetical protein OTERR_18650 [Oryzomicrobium terrae]|uniref:Uncharacterized protein n=1 Tax=Oryzomicrobium terrae TaxID=1735038 RepID=A0A5C1E8P8_9RHOO|nr:hypothetical protein OTERR_18650 [Oryzomicrobium terrae]